MRLLTTALLLLSLGWEAFGKPKKFGDRNKPVLELPYGRFEAYSERDGLWTFKNIPFAAPPEGDLRWAKPQPPLNVTGLQKGHSRGALPYQVWLDKLKVVPYDNDRYDEYGNPLDRSLKEEASLVMGYNSEYMKSHIFSEDSLLLDIVVPQTALVDPELSLPVVVFILGGGFMGGGKEKNEPLLPLYDGYGLVKQSKEEMIFVVFNYRVGAFGFLGGTTMEREAVPNVGLWDQRAALQWVRDYVHLVGGNPADVTAMGHSAGGSSIMHHLTAEGGTLDPLFNRAIVLSPAYVPSWDREGEIEDRFQHFAALAGCEGLGLECLRTRTAGQLQHANLQVALRDASSVYSWGPVPDGSYIRQLPMLEWAQGNIWPIEKLILSGNGWSYDYLAGLLPQQSFEEGWFDEVLKLYPYWNPGEASWAHLESRFQSELQRMQTIVLHSCFTCHMRWLIEALGEERCHLMYYAVWPHFHGADLVTLFWNDESRWASFCEIIGTVARGIMGFFYDYPEFIATYRQYFVNFITKNGNPSPDDAVVPWKHPVLHLEDENKTHMVGQVLGVAIKEPYYYDTPVAEIEIGTMPQSKCAFWFEFFANASANGNYSVYA